MNKEEAKALCKAMKIRIMTPEDLAAYCEKNGITLAIDRRSQDWVAKKGGKEIARCE